MQDSDFEEIVRRARGAGPAVTIGLVAAAAAALFVGFKLLRFGLRAAPALSTAMTVVGVLLWLREQLDESRHDDRDDDYA